MPEFKVVSDFAPLVTSQRRRALAEGLDRGDRYQTLLGITGSGSRPPSPGRSSRCRRPTLVLAPNKALAAQLANEFRQFFPQNRVEYFVSYYDYYQPEAYMPQTDTYIEKDATINDEIDRLRHSATAGLLVRNDVIIVASVSAIYGWARRSSTWGSFFDWCRGGVSDEGCDPASGRHPVRAQRGQSDPRQVPVKGDTLEVFLPMRRPSSESDSGAMRWSASSG